jgi:hypothetical protein
MRRSGKRPRQFLLGFYGEAARDRVRAVIVSVEHIVSKATRRKKLCQKQDEQTYGKRKHKQVAYSSTPHRIYSTGVS